MGYKLEIFFCALKEHIWFITIMVIWWAMVKYHKALTAFYSICGSLLLFLLYWFLTYSSLVVELIMVDKCAY